MICYDLFLKNHNLDKPEPYLFDTDYTDFLLIGFISISNFLPKKSKNFTDKIFSRINRKLGISDFVIPECQGKRSFP